MRHGMKAEECCASWLICRFRQIAIVISIVAVARLPPTGCSLFEAIRRVKAIPFYVDFREPKNIDSEFSDGFAKCAVFNMRRRFGEAIDINSGNSE